ncbi:hypothetical protein [Streptomyces sp. GC420]|nr:hypothetical protein [Streptomyces sp. GC420]
MPDLTALLAAAEEQGVGNALRALIVVSVVGAGLPTWFLLRGYRDNG